MARDFRKIIVWQKADDLAVEIYEITRANFPKDETYGLIRRFAGLLFLSLQILWKDQVENRLRIFYAF